MDTPQTHRPIRSFVLRQGYMSKGQQRAYDTLMPVLGVGYQPQVADLDAVFGRAAPKVVEIGFGMGGATADIAQARPDTDYLGVEVHGPGVGSLLKLVEERQLGNVRVIQHDAVEVFTHMLAPASLDGVHVFFPDPWHKKRHNKRRLIQPEFANLLVRKLRPGGRLHLATDWEPYAEHMWDVLDATEGLVNRAGPRGAVPRPDWRPQTHFETRGQKLGHGVWDLLYDRV